MMNNFLELYKKVGGTEILRQYKKVGVLFFALTEVLRLGFSKKSLEILRLSVQFKIQKNLKKKYSYVLERFENKNVESLSRTQSNKVWVCWLQGMENAPLLVKRCYESLQKYLTDREIIIITEKNFSEYITFPDYILEKWTKGIITNTHFSDLLRLELLIKYGGLWIDATVLCTNSNIPKYILDSELFLYQVLKPGRDGHCIPFSSWLICACSNNKILLLTRELLYEYWIKNNFMIDYFLIHQFLSISAEYYKEDWNRIPKMSNSIPHILLLELFDEYEDKHYQILKNMTCFSKLSYKYDSELFERRDTYYDVIIEKGKY